MGQTLPTPAVVFRLPIIYTRIRIAYVYFVHIAQNHVLRSEHNMDRFRIRLHSAESRIFRMNGMKGHGDTCIIGNTRFPFRETGRYSTSTQTGPLLRTDMYIRPVKYCESTLSTPRLSPSEPVRRFCAFF